jgi:hypothetical protein
MINPTSDVKNVTTVAIFYELLDRGKVHVLSDVALFNKPSALGWCAGVGC